MVRTACYQFLLLLAIAAHVNCNNANSGAQLKVAWWLTTGSQSSLLEAQDPLPMGGTGSANKVTVDTAVAYQTVDGFGYTLTGGSSILINSLDSAVRSALLNELFSNGDGSLGISYLRLSIGASDLNADVFSYDDMPSGKTDPELKFFSLNKDREGGTGLIPLLKEILKVNPALKIMATPWSAPVWMKDNNSSKGGSLQKKYFGVYAKYFEKYIQEMKAEGISIDAITPQNEPLHPGNNPSMYMTAEDQAEFIRDHLGPVLRKAGLATKIVVYDHNCNKPEYPITILNDTAAGKYVDGTAFHLYEGDISALSTVRNAHPDKHLYFTEQWTGSKGSFDGDLLWHTENVIIGSMRNWSRIALEWNLANDSAFNPHTPGGCTECKGALTITGNQVARNVSYYIIGHASRFVPPGSIRINSNGFGSVPNVAFKTPAGKFIIIIQNNAKAETTFDIVVGAGSWKAKLPAGSVVTFELSR